MPGERGDRLERLRRSREEWQGDTMCNWLNESYFKREEKSGRGEGNTNHDANDQTNDERVDLMVTAGVIKDGHVRDTDRENGCRDFTALGY